MAYIKKNGGTKSKNLSLIADNIVQWSEDRNIVILASYLLGKFNLIADRQSRMERDASDWMLLATELKKLEEVWSISVDLFASAWNTQIETFVSWIPQPDVAAVNAFSISWKGVRGYAFPWRIPQPDAAAVNAFSISWKGIWSYAFPPLALIPRVLSKVKRDKAEIILVCPLWPSQAWFPALLQIAIDIPRVFPLIQFTSLNLIFENLTDLFHSDAATASINIHRSMLSMTLDPIEGQLLKGCYNTNPPEPRFNSLWNPEFVL